MEVLTATLLFILLSPGLIFTLPPGKGGILSGDSTSNIAILVHACIFFVLQKLTAQGVFPFNFINDAVAEIRASRNDPKNPNYVAGLRALPVTIAPLAATLLFILLSPGLLVTLPPDEGALFMSEDTNTIAVLVHGVIYFIALKFWADNIGYEKDKYGNVVLDGSGNPKAGNMVVNFLNEQLNSV